MNERLESQEDDEELTAVIDGTVTYRERSSLHPQCVLHVRLLDVSRADAPATVLGEQQYTTEGKQVPLPFAIPYDPEQIDPRFSYSVSARILDPEGKLIYISDTTNPVITRDNPTGDVQVALVRVPRRQ